MTNQLMITLDMGTHPMNGETINDILARIGPALNDGYDAGTLAAPNGREVGSWAILPVRSGGYMVKS